ncbi:ArsI/CadI family heavy metal resistance metalloenzyme [soil metagenome]
MVQFHLSLRVKDVERSTQFYRAFFGTEPHKVRPGYANFSLTNPALKLALFEAEIEGKGSLDHLGFVVDTRQAVADAKQRMIDAGLTAFSEEEVTCCHATQDKIWVTDPDGNNWEIYVVLDDQVVVSAEKPMQMLPVIKGECCEAEGKS